MLARAKLTPARSQPMRALRRYARSHLLEYGSALLQLGIQPSRWRLSSYRYLHRSKLCEPAEHVCSLS